MCGFHCFKIIFPLFFLGLEMVGELGVFEHCFPKVRPYLRNTYLFRPINTLSKFSQTQSPERNPCLDISSDARSGVALELNLL